MYDATKRCSLNFDVDIVAECMIVELPLSNQCTRFIFILLSVLFFISLFVGVCFVSVHFAKCLERMESV